jgi:hypothetical protein
MSASWPGPPQSGPFVPPPTGRHRIDRAQIATVPPRADSRDMRELHEAGPPAGQPAHSAIKARWRLVLLLELMPAGLVLLLGVGIGALTVAIVVLLAGSGGEPAVPVSGPGLQVSD